MKGHWTEELEQLYACPESIKWAKQFDNPLAAWKACKNLDWMLWLLTELGYNERLPYDPETTNCGCVECAFDGFTPDEIRYWIPVPF